MNVRCLVIFVHPAENGVGVGDFVEEQQLREHVFFGRNGVIRGVIAIQGSVHLFYEARDRLDSRFSARNFGQLKGSEFIFQFLDSLHVRWILQCVGIVEFHHHVEVVKAPEFSAEHIQEPHHIRNLLAHGLGVVHVHVDVCYSRNLEQHDCACNDGDNDAVSANLASEKFKENVGLGGSRRLDHVGFWFRIAPETHENGNQYHHIEANHRHDARRDATNPTDRPNARK